MFCFCLCFSICFHIVASVTVPSSCWPCSFSCSCPCLFLHPFCFINLSCSFHSRCCTQILFDVLRIVDMVIRVAIRPRFGKMMEVRGLRIPFASPISVRLHVPVLVPVLFTCSCSHLYSRFRFYSYSCIFRSLFLSFVYVTALVSVAIFIYIPGRRLSLSCQA